MLNSFIENKFTGSREKVPFYLSAKILNKYFKFITVWGLLTWVVLDFLLQLTFSSYSYIDFNKFLSVFSSPYHNWWYTS